MGFRVQGCGFRPNLGLEFPSPPQDDTRVRGDLCHLIRLPNTTRFTPSEEQSRDVRVLTAQDHPENYELSSIRLRTVFLGWKKGTFHLEGYFVVPGRAHI